MLARNGLWKQEAKTSLYLPACRIKKNGNGGLFPRWVVDTIAAGSSILAGVFTAWREILSESYANFSSLDLIDDIKQKYRTHFGEKFLQDIQEQKAKGIPIDTKKTVEDILKQNDAYNVAVEQRFKETGFDKFSNRMKLLSTHEKWKIGLTALAVTGVSLGSLLLVTRDMFRKKEDDEKSFTQKEEMRRAQESARTQTNTVP